MSSSDSGFSDDGELFSSSDDELLVASLQAVKEKKYEDAEALISKLQSRIDNKEVAVNTEEQKAYTANELKSKALQELAQSPDAVIHEDDDDNDTATGYDGLFEPLVKRQKIKIDEDHVDDSNIFDNVVDADPIIESAKKARDDARDKSSKHSNPWEKLTVLHSDEDKFLYDYFSGKKWKTEHDGSVAFADTSGVATHNESINLDDDEEQIQLGEDFEHKYNLRSDGAVKSYARNSQESVAKLLTETARARRRAEKKLQKQQKVKSRTNEAADELAYVTKLIEQFHEDTLKEAEESEDYSDSAEWYCCDGCYYAVELGSNVYLCSECNYILCKRCKRKQEHQHNMIRQKNNKQPPKSWKLKVIEQLLEKRIELLANFIAKSALFDVDGDFKYQEIPKSERRINRPLDELIDEIYYGKDADTTHHESAHDVDSKRTNKVTKKSHKKHKARSTEAADSGVTPEQSI